MVAPSYDTMMNLTGRQLVASSVGIILKGDEFIYRG